MNAEWPPWYINTEITTLKLFQFCQTLICIFKNFNPGNISFVLAMSQVYLNHSDSYLPSPFLTPTKWIVVPNLTPEPTWCRDFGSNLHFCIWRPFWKWRHIYIFLCKKWTQGHHITLEIKFGWNPTTFKIVRFLPPFWIGHHFENWRPFWIFLKVTCTPSRVIVIKVSHFSPKPL